MFSIIPAISADIELMRAIDDDAASLFAAHGVEVELAPDHPFSRAELARWLRSAELGRAFLAVDHSGAGLGFAALDLLDGDAYLDQLSVRMAAMRRGIGGRLLAHAAEWSRAAGASSIWLTTYAHLPFNQAYYEERGYLAIPESNCGPGIQNHLDEQRRYLPAPGHRIAMRLLL